MLEFKKWIGERINISGSYYATTCKELQKRHGSGDKLYRFNSRFGEEYYISDSEEISKIEDLLMIYETNSAAIYEYLYCLVIEKFGMIDFLSKIGHKIAEQRDQGYRAGKLAKQKEIIEALGIN